MNKRLRVCYTLSRPYDIYHLGRILTALWELGARKELELKITRLEEGLQGDELTLCLRVEDPDTGSQRYVAIEMMDHNDRFCLPALEYCDVYFKRSFLPKKLEALPEQLRCKVRPFGLNYAARCQGALQVAAGSLLSLAASAGADPVTVLPLTRSYIGRLRNFIDSPHADEMEVPAEQKVEPIVVFQTRIWDDDDLGSDRMEEVNKPRLDLIRLLKRELGSSFRGGLLPTPLALKYYPELITREPCGRREYIAFSKQALIGISTRGLHHSLPFKLGEYLSSSKCIISEPFLNMLPTPLVPGTNYLQFDTAGECVDHCLKLLSAPELAQKMRCSNWQYYLKEVRPVSQMRNCLATAWQGEGND